MFLCPVDTGDPALSVGLDRFAERVASQLSDPGAEPDGPVHRRGQILFVPADEGVLDHRGYNYFAQGDIGGDALADPLLGDLGPPSADGDVHRLRLLSSWSGRL